MWSKNLIKILTFILLFFTSLLYSQSQKSKVIDIEGKGIVRVQILIKDKLGNQNFQITDTKGNFEIDYSKFNLPLELQFRKFGYQEDIVILHESKPIEITLLEEATIELVDLILYGKKKAFEIKEDTIVYNVSSYADGSERKIEEVIDKLPGMEVDPNNGTIKYKGKPIETVLLGDDNLFESNYTLGTKNINVDMVEQIEAIDNYAENKLLKGIEQDGKVAINLKLKKNILNFSGNLDYGSGWFEGGKQAFDLNSNIIGISKSIKSFSTINYNNIGKNSSPFQYLSNTLNYEQFQEQDYFAEKVIPETQFSNLLEDSRANINNQFFGNYNAIFKLHPKLSIKTNLYYLQDRITTNQLFKNDFQINNDIFTTTDNTFITKKPQQYRGDLEIKYNTSKTSLLEYNLRLRQENIETPTTVIQNQTEEFNTFLSTEDFYLKQDLLWTKKLSDKKALQISLFHSFNDLPQTFNIIPSLFDENALNDTQKSEFKRTFLEGKATYLGSGNRDKYTFAVGANLNQSPFVSRLFNSEETISENNFHFTQSNIFNTGVYNFNRGKWQISPSYSLRVLNQRLEENLESQEETQDDFVFEPAVKIKYTLNSVSFLTASTGYEQNTNAEQYFFLNQILINNRTTISNLPSLELQNSQRYSLLYFNNDLYNQFQLNANVSYQKSTGNFFTNQNITENTTQIEYFFLPQDNSNWNMNMQVSKYIPFIESTLKVSSNYSISNFRNVVNNSNLRQNQSQFLSNSLFWKTAFDILVNFENTFTYQHSTSKSENQSAFTNNAWQNTFKVIVKPSKKWFLILSSDYYLPNTEQSDEQFFFLDATLRHRPKSKKWEASFIMRNLTNEENFEQVQTSDISTTIFRSNLLPRYFLLNLTWNF